MENPIAKIKQYYGETIDEVKKCSWPSRRELVQHTILVIAATVLLAAFIACTDTILEQVVLGVFKKLPELLN